MADLSKMRDLCSVLGLDILQRIRSEVDDSVGDLDSWEKSALRVETVHRLSTCVERLCKLKLDRFTEIKKKALTIISYWNNLFTPFEEKQELIGLLYYVQAESENEITKANALSLELVNKVENEYYKLREQINVLVLKKKTKMLQILKNTHLPASFVNDKDISDPLAALLVIRKQISEMKELAGKRAETVMKIELIEYSSQERDWSRVPSKLLKSLKAELSNMREPFIYNGEDALKRLSTATAELTHASTTEKATAEVTQASITEKATAEVTQASITEKAATRSGQTDAITTKKAGTSAGQAVEPEVGSQPPHMDLFGVVPRATRTPRVPLEAVLPPARSSPPSPLESNNSDDESMYSDSEDEDYDPQQDL